MIFGKHINRYYLKYSYMLISGIIALFFVDYFQLKIPEYYRMVINGMNTGFSDGIKFDLDFVLDKICLPMIVVIVILILGRILWRVCFYGVAVNVETDMRQRMFLHAETLTAEFYHANKVGELMSLFTNDLETIHECFNMGFLMFFDAAILGTLAVVKMWKLDEYLTCFAMIPMALLVAIGVVIGKSMKKKWGKRQEAFAALSDFSQETFSGIAVIKAFVKEGIRLLSFKKLNRENENSNIEYTKISAVLGILVTLFAESVICVILGYGGFLVYNNTFEIGHLVEFMGYFTSVIWPVTALSQLIELTSRGKASLKRVEEFLDKKPTVKDRCDAKKIENIKGRIEFSSLTFKYPETDKNVLKDVSFVIEPGENVGIVGKTGSGKTTIADLILHTYNIPDASVFIDGVDINKIPLSQLHEICAYVPQDNFVFSDTIENNISFSNSGYSDEEIINVSKLAGLDEDIKSFSEGYKTILGERGTTVSGGQRQRIAIARALIKDSCILIFDDSVSAVDTKTERIILDNLKTERKNKTTIFISHRISTVSGMDKIIYIEDGKVVATGTHRELYETCDAYKIATDLQKLDEEEYVNA